jgi:hypothetical protein
MVPWVFIALENGDTGDKLLTMTTRMFFIGVKMERTTS